MQLGGLQLNGKAEGADDGGIIGQTAGGGNLLKAPLDQGRIAAVVLVIESLQLGRVIARNVGQSGNIGCRTE